MNDKKTFFPCLSAAIDKSKFKFLFCKKIAEFYNLLGIKIGKNFTKNEKSQDYNFPDYNELRTNGRKARTRFDISDDLNGLINFKILHKMREADIKEKVKTGKKIRVCFFVDSASKFPFKHIYEQMKKGHLFYPFIALYNTFEGEFNNDSAWNCYLEDLEYLRKQGYEVQEGYSVHRKYIPIENFNPDIVFLCPYYLDNIFMFLSNTYLNLNFLCCQVNYGFNTLKLYPYQYNNYKVNVAWKFFVETQEDYAELMRHSTHFGANAILAGAPKMDDYAKHVEECLLPPKLDNGKPVVIYAPHHSLNHDVADCTGCFDEYYQIMLDMVKNNPEINFVFRPHPSLHSTVRSSKLMSSEEWDKYIAEWDCSPNGLYSYGSDYIELFRRSQLLITDSASFIFEWLPSGSPCVYLKAPHKKKETLTEGFTRQAEKILKTYHLCENPEDIKDLVDKIIIKKIDIYKRDREKLCDEIFYDIGNASSNIVNHLTNVFEGNDI